jgi:hypothetical protein
MKKEDILRRSLLKLTKRYTIYFKYKEKLEKRLDDGRITDKEREVLFGLEKKIKKTLDKIQKVRNKYEG